MLQRFFRLVHRCTACGDDYWRVEDLLVLFPTLFVGLLDQPGSDTWDNCLIHLQMC